MFIHAFVTYSLILNKYDFYAGTFDTIDKEGDDQTTLVGFEHQNTVLFKDTFIGKLSPITGGFISGKDSIIYIQV